MYVDVGKRKAALELQKAYVVQTALKILRLRRGETDWSMCYNTLRLIKEVQWRLSFKFAWELRSSGLLGILNKLHLQQDVMTQQICDTISKRVAMVPDPLTLKFAGFCLCVVAGVAAIEVTRMVGKQASSRKRRAAEHAAPSC